MIIESEQASGECDHCNKNRATHGVVSQGATGRWCETIWLCRQCAVDWAGGEDKILSTAAARRRCNQNGWADF